MKTVLIDCGYSIVKIKTNETGAAGVPSLHVINQSTSDETGFSPAQDASIWGEPEIIKLRDALLKEFPLDKYEVVK